MIKTMELTEKQYEIFEKVKSAWEERVGKGNVDEEGLKRIIIVADTDKDGLKRISLIGSDNKVHLVPIEVIILNGLKSSDLREDLVDRDAEDKKRILEMRDFLRANSEFVYTIEEIKKELGIEQNLDFVLSRKERYSYSVGIRMILVTVKGGHRVRHYYYEQTKLRALLDFLKGKIKK